MKNKSELKITELLDIISYPITLHLNLNQEELILDGYYINTYNDSYFKKNKILSYMHRR